VTIDAIRHEADLAAARQSVRTVAHRQGLRVARTEALATAVTEIGRNILAHAEEGELRVEPIVQAKRRGVLAVLRDRGPGIADLETAMQDGFSTSDGLGLGLAGARRLVDEFEITSSPSGTVVTLRQWAP
jgi:serine/threonine-protein kinase RsbT